MHTTIIVCTILLSILTLGLGFFVSVRRAQTGEVSAPGSDPASPLTKAVRAHGNASEYIGPVIGLFLMTGFVYAGRDLGLLASSLIVLITLARVSHAIGLLTCETLAKPNPFRFAGALLTYCLGIGLGLFLLGRIIF